MAPTTSEKETILLCDDEPAVIRLVRTLLTLHGYQVLEATNGQEALDVAEKYKEPIHLLLSDVMMPGVGGPELAEQLRVVRPDVRVIFMSAYGDESIGSYDGCPFVQKPFSPSGLIKTVVDTLAQPSKPLRRNVIGTAQARAATSKHP